MRIAYQGVSGAYSEAAALLVKETADLLPCPAFEDVFAAVVAGKATHGILPIENTIAGTIHQNYDLLLEHELKIVAEVKLPVVHHLIVNPGTKLEQVRRVYSHPQGLAQCERFLRTLDNVEIVASYDTAGSAKMIKEEALTDSAAIASQRDGATVWHPGLCWQHDPVSRRQSGRHTAGATRQDHDRVHGGE
jgi:prephenate dehydratase